VQLPLTVEDLRAVGLILLAGTVVSLLLALILFLFVVRRLRHLNVPRGAGYGETLMYTPLSLVIFIDLLDWGLDILAAPIVWVVLDRLGLRALRNVSTIEALIPFTQFIPTLTLSWIWVRLFGYESFPLDAIDADGDSRDVIENPPQKRR
jgi:hypothetical protein